MLKNNNSGFTVVELLVSFVIVMTISLGLFATVDNYRERQQKELAKKEVNAYRNEIIKIIQDDIIINRLKSIEGTNIDDCNQSIILTFDMLDPDVEHKKALCMRENEIEYGDYTKIAGVNDVDGIIYKAPDDFIKFVNKVIYYDTGATTYDEGTVYNNGYKITTDRKIYAINLEVEHTELKQEFNINIVAPTQSIKSTSQCYEITSGVITKYHNDICPISGTTLKIPTSLYGISVTGIEPSAFDGYVGNLTLDLTGYECISGIKSGWGPMFAGGQLRGNYGGKYCSG